MIVTLHDVQLLADQLSPLDKARLAARLNSQLAQALAGTRLPQHEQTTTDAWLQLLAFRRDMELLGADAPDFATQLDQDRRTRAETLEGPERVHS